MAEESPHGVRMWLNTAFVLVTLFLGHFVAGSFKTLNVALVAIKDRFNYTQTEVELILSAVPLGFGLGMPAGVLVDRLGPRWTSVIALCMSVPGYGLAYLATVLVEFFKSKAWLLSIFLFLAGQGSFATFTVCWTIGVRRAPARVRGVLMGVLNSVLHGSSAAFTLIYDAFYEDGHAEDPKKQNFGGYILLLLVLHVLADLLNIVFLRNDDTQGDKQVGDDRGGLELTELEKSECSATWGKMDRSNPHENGDKTMHSEGHEHANYKTIGTSMENLDSGKINFTAKTSTDKDSTSMPRSSINDMICSDEKAALVPDDPSTSEHTPLIQLLQDVSFMRFLLSFSLAVSADFLIYANIQIIAESRNFAGYSTFAMVMSRVVIIVSTFGSGIVLQWFPYHSCRVVCYSLGVATSIVANIIMLSVDESLEGFLLSVGMSALGNGAILVFAGAITFHQYCQKDYGRNWGILVMASILFVTVVFLIAGQLYDAQLSLSSSYKCVGSQCTYGWFLMILCCSCVSLALCTWELVTFWGDLPCI